MQRTARLLASVKGSSRFLEANAPTGLTGLFTHPAPRSTLIYIYSSTLEKLKKFPEDSVYRQSVEALTKHRLSIVNSVVPAGYEEWAARAKKTIADHPEVFNTPEGGVDYAGGRHLKVVVDGKTFVNTKIEDEKDELIEEWDGEKDLGPTPEGSRTAEERESHITKLGAQRPGEDAKTVTWEPEPPLDSQQISEMENKIGAGLIEEVIQVAEGELALVDVLSKAEVWADLEEKPVEGQWTYFMRDSGTGTTQKPVSPQK